MLKMERLTFRIDSGDGRSDNWRENFSPVCVCVVMCHLRLSVAFGNATEQEQILQDRTGHHILLSRTVSYNTQE